MSSLDYYNLLELPRTATHEEIQNSFKRLGQKFNPHSNLTNQAANQEIFHLICESYEVLSHHEKKAQFDKYGEFGLKNGVSSRDGHNIKPYIYLGNAEQIFNDFMKETHLNDEQFELDGSDIYGSLFSDAHRGKT